MNNKVCFMFGHADMPYDAASKIESAAERHYLEYGVRTFIVGNRGNFDHCAASAIKALKRRYTDITLLLLLAYHPAEQAVDLPDGFDNSYYPPLVGIPKPYAIVRANQHMAAAANSVICYVKHFGNTRSLLEFAHRRRRDIPIENVAEN